MKLLSMKIDNKQVNDIYLRWNGIWENEELPLETRLKAYSQMRTISALVSVYENGEMLDEESIDDLFIAWSKSFKPILPEEIPNLLKRIMDRNDHLN